MADIPGPPPGIAMAIGQNRPVTAADILGGAIPAGTTEAPAQSTQPGQPTQSGGAQQSVQKGAVDLADSINGYISSLPSTAGITQKNTAGTNEIAAGQVAVNTAIQQAKAKEIADNASAAAAFGLTPGAADGTIAKYSQAITEAEQQLDAKRGEILGKQQQSFFDNPIQWLFNQVALPYDIAEFHTLNGVAAHKLDILKRMEEATLDAFRINQGVDQATASAVLDGQNKIALGQAQVAQAASEVQTTHLGIEETSVRMTGTKEAFNASVQAHQSWLNDINKEIAAATLNINQRGMDNNDQRLLLEQNTAQRQEEQAKVTLARTQLDLGNEQQSAAARLDLNARLAQAAQVWKVLPITIDQLKIMGDGPTKRFWENAIQDPDVQNGKAPALGYNTVDALNKANAVNAPLTPSINYVRDKLIKVRDDVIAPQALTWKTLSKDSQEVILQNAFIAATKKEVANIPDEGGIFSPGSLRNTLTIGQGEASLANTKIGAALAPAARADPTLPTKASLIIDTAVNLIQAGKMTPAEGAKEINRIYLGIVQDNNELRQYQEFRLNPLDPQVNGFKTTVQFGNDWGSKSVVNMLSPSAVEAVLTRSILRQNYQNNFPAGMVQ